MARNTLSRSLHDVGLSAWFGGTLANAVALNPAAGRGEDRTRHRRRRQHRLGPVDARQRGGDRPAPRRQRGSARRQQGPGRSPAGRRLDGAGQDRSHRRGPGCHGVQPRPGQEGVPAPRRPGQDATTPTAAHPDDAAKAQAQLRVLQWVVPALTGTLVVVSSFAGEQQRASEVSKGILGRVTLGR